MNKPTILEILNKAYEEEPLATLVVNNKTKDITISRHGSPAPLLGNMEELYKANKGKVDKTVKALVQIVRDFEEDIRRKNNEKTTKTES